TAREAIKIMGELVAEYGYYSSGESFSISDPNEVWFMDLIGKGEGNKGAVWVVRQIPDGYISAHANQARIRTFPLENGKTSITFKNINKIFNKKVTTVYSEDVITFAREKGWFKGMDKDFSFVDAYAPLTYGALRFCEARVYAMFNRAAPSKNLTMDYVKGVENAEPMPLWIKPDKKVSVHDVMEYMRDHFEGTDFDMTKDIGAGPYKLPYRWRGLTWEVDSVKYCNERATSTQQTGFSFVTQSRSWLPDVIGGVFWFGVDDAYSTVYMPMYCGIKKAPHNVAVGTGDFQNFTWESAFWVFNWVSNYSYLRYSEMIVDVQKAQRQLEGHFFAMQPQIDKAAEALYNQAPELARDYLTDYSVSMTEKTMKRWTKLGTDLLVKYMDGNLKNEHGKVKHPGYPKSWYRTIIKETGDHFKMKKLPGEGDSH
ncbi:MAG: C69 family dipeptidase, partial [Calditrichia bacterium]|nr:C69 family dipeptidase [Calditrichia bacterium]